MQKQLFKRFLLYQYLKIQSNYKNKMITDALLRNYVDQVFMTYDRDRSNSLQPTQLANFFNDVFERMHNPTRYNVDQARQALRRIDSNFDGRATRAELFNALKKMIADNQFTNDDYHGKNSRVSGTSSIQNPSYLSNNSRVEQNYQGTYGQQNMNVSGGQYVGQTNTMQNQFNTYAQGSGYGQSSNVYQVKNSPGSVMSTNYNQSQAFSQPQPQVYSQLQPQVGYVEATQILHPTSILSSNIQTVPLTTTIIAQPQVSKLTTVTLPGYTKVTTETYTTTTTYDY